MTRHTQVGSRRRARSHRVHRPLRHCWHAGQCAQRLDELVDLGSTS
jgi:hypothetical protein